MSHSFTKAVGAVVLLLSVVSSWTRNADACATCGCGDPTLTAMGTEKPYRDRLRLSLDARHRSDDIGEPDVDRIRLRETRFDGQVAWAPNDRLFVMGTVPLLRRSIRYVNGGETDTTAMGDIELRAKAFLFTDRAFAPRHLFAVVGGLKIPSAPRQKSEVDGSYLPIEAQPGTGSWDPLLGMSYAFFARPWSFYASVQGSAPLRGKQVFRASASVRTTTTAQYQVLPELAVRVGLDTRTDGRSYEDGVPERDSSGFIAFASPELVFSPVTDLLVVLSLRVPVASALAGYHHEGPVMGAGLAYDF